MGVSLKDVALRAGVSVKTVSNVVNDYPHVTHRTRERVQRAIDELGYRPNLTARHLRKGRTGIITLAIPELGNPYFAEVAGAVIDAAARHELTVLLDHTAGLREKELLVSQGFRSHVIDGLILSPIRLEGEDLLERTEGPPMVLLGEREYDAPYDHIMIDNIGAARIAVRHLLDLGRRRIAFLGARRESSRQPAHLRLRGWREALNAAGPGPRRVHGGVHRGVRPGGRRRRDGIPARPRHAPRRDLRLQRPRRPGRHADPGRTRPAGAGGRRRGRFRRHRGRTLRRGVTQHGRPGQGRARPPRGGLPRRADRQAVAPANRSRPRRILPGHRLIVRESTAIRRA